MKFITFEGGEGSGKTTQSKLLREAFAKCNIDVIWTREPGGTESAEKIRQLLLERDSDRFHPMSELLLINAARFDHADKIINPALKEGKIVICDRFVDSTMAYQGFGHKLGRKIPAIIHNYTMQGLSPDLTFILDIDPAIGLERARTSAPNYYESLDLAFHQRVQRGFHEILELAYDRCILLDASKPIEKVHKEIIAIINERSDLNLKEMKISEKVK